MGISLWDCENIVIHGMDGTRIVSDSGSDIIISIDSCKNITLINLVLDHDIPTVENESHDCTAGVVKVNDSSEVAFINCDIFGCGLWGIDGMNNAISICSDGSVKTTLMVSECIFSGNGNPQCIGASGADYSIDNCTFFGNAWGGDNVSSNPEPYGKTVNEYLPK